MSSAEHAGSQGAGGITPSRAVVIPRVRITGQTAAIPLEHRIEELLDCKRRGLVNLIGPPGSGKTTALQHVAAVLGKDAPLYLVDNRLDPKLRSLAGNALVLVASQQPIDSRRFLVLEMTSWTEEDLASYVLATHPARCRSVMGRVLADADRDLLCGLPELWRIVLDEMAADDSIASIDLALSTFLDRELGDEADRQAAEENALNSLAPWAGCLSNGGREDPHSPMPSLIERLLRHHFVQLSLGANHFVKRLQAGTAARYLHVRPPLDLLWRVAGLIAKYPAIQLSLAAVTGGSETALHATAASLLHATGIGWRPADKQVLNLSDAWLVAADWDGIQLPGARFTRADLSKASLANADLTGASLDDVTLAGTTLRNASLRGAKLTGANLRGANLAGATADGADFDHADLSDANLCGASLRAAMLRNATLQNARFCRADLVGADLKNASIEGADFTGAKLAGAMLDRQPIHQCILGRTIFSEAKLRRANLEGLTASEMDFERAVLDGALLTGSELPRTSFFGASLRGCGLAEIEWEGADLRNADLRGSTFHMGTTRSGLVGSSVPCEGSRTGFYTDEYFDTGFKSPEEIRKANLCWADLRDAVIDEVDFYLVDLRHAKYSEEQAEWFRKCGAILCDR